MAKVFMISSNVTVKPYPVYPLGMAMVSHDLRRRGHETLEWDFLAQGESVESLIEAIKAFAPEVIGISIRNIDNCNYGNLVTYTQFCINIVSAIRASSGSFIVLGGSGYSLFPDILLERTGADYGIVGEGEVVFADLVESLAAGRLPPEKTLCAKTPLRGDEVAIAERNPAHIDFYMKSGGMINVQTKRGCPFKCAYCTYPFLEGRSFRRRPAKDVADEIQMLVEKHNIDYYFIADSVYNDTGGQYLEITEELVRRGITVPWMAYFKPGKFRQADVELLKRSGLRAVEWGTDCASDRTLKGMGKSFSWKDVAHSNAVFSAANIYCAHFIIFGGPAETPQTVEEGLANIARLENCVVFAATGIRVIPGTPMHQRALKEGAVSAEDNLLEPVFYFSPDVTAEYLDTTISGSFSARADRIYPIESNSEMATAFHKRGYRGPVWDLLIGQRSPFARLRA
jgi:radical SAM superfamily enzyme YgiQ (UPF0313 family)